MFLKHVPNIKMSSKYTITSLMQIKSPSILFIILWKVAGALENPKYITVASKKPRFVINTVFYSSSSLIQTLLYLHLKSILVKIEALLSDSIKSAILGIG